MIAGRDNPLKIKNIPDQVKLASGNRMLFPIQETTFAQTNVFPRSKTRS